MKTTSLTPLAAVIFTMASLAVARAETKTLHYPTQDTTMFSIDAPAEWEVTEIQEVGEYGSLESENGSVLQFRAVECASEQEAIKEIESIADDRSAGRPEASIARTRATAAASHTAPRVVRIPTRVESAAALRKARPVGKTPQR